MTEYDPWYVRNNRTPKGDDERKAVEDALRCMGAQVDEVSSWPTVAEVLGREVLRLRTALDNAPDAMTPDGATVQLVVPSGQMQHTHMIEALVAASSALAGTEGPDRLRGMKKAITHLREALDLEPEK